MTNGYFIISLDFELYWGMFDVISKEDYQDNILGVRVALPRMLKMFEENEIYATWATVGLLFAENTTDLLNNVPQKAPSYKNNKLSAYNHAKEIGDNEIEDPFHYGISLINLIKQTPFQKIGSHTFSHYYCLEDGQTKEEFIEDLKAFNRISKGTEATSIVFPRNQVNEDYLESCALHGLKSYRGVEKAKFYNPRAHNGSFKHLSRALRLADSYINIFGYNTYRKEAVELNNGLINLPASRFLRPYFRKLKFLEKLKLHRILNGMTHAAKNKEIYHLWWHPHNSGNDIEENLKQLELIIKHYKKLNEKYNWESTNMEEMASIIINSRQEIDLEVEMKQTLW